MNEWLQHVILPVGLMILMIADMSFGTLWGFKILYRTVFYKPKRADATQREIILDKIIGVLVTLDIWFAMLVIFKIIGSYLYSN